MAEVAEGTLVDGRYLIKTRIGSGGMADVYLAEDRQLGRDIALKVLHRRFSRDREFVERFRREASAAAGLQHPHVVAVFDRGEHDDTYYIAMENLRGRTLKQLIQEEAPLSQLRAIALAIQILQAAGFAHRRGVIHRDFKPHNVIVGSDERLKVTDFGIARAGASEMTETGSIMGTAQYLSPEQAQGQRVDAPSDLYSIGVIIFEMLTGRVPFEGDSAVSIALKHVSEPPPALRSVRPDVHPALEAVVARALAKDPAQRYGSADEFIAALEAARAAIAGEPNGQGTGVFAAPLPPPDPRGPRWPLILLAVLLLALAGGVVAWRLVTAANQRVVPPVIGKREDAARATLARAGLLTSTHRLTSSRPTGTVVDEHPGAGAKVDDGSTVSLGISSGPPIVQVPPVANLPRADAVRALRAVGLVPAIDQQPSDTVPPGVAVGTDPPVASSLRKGSRVALHISSGPPPIFVPDLHALQRDAAIARLSGLGLTATTQLADSSLPKGEVVSQDPAAGSQVRKGSSVTLAISKGKPMVPVPDVSGKSQADATGTLTGAGFKVKVQQVPSTQAKGTVIGESPAAGSKQPQGSTVTIQVAQPKPGGSGPGTGGTPATPTTPTTPAQPGASP